MKALMKAERDFKKHLFEEVVTDQGYIFVALHCHSSIESMLPKNPVEQRMINWLLENGYEQINRIDCTQRREDRFDVIMYHFRKYYTPEGDDHEFIKDLKNPEYRYTMFQVYHKWGIV
jgi:hypothetical protein